MKKKPISILFWIGVFIILISNISLIMYKNSINIIPPILFNILFTSIALCMIIIGWIYKCKYDSEKYDDLANDYDYALQSGNLVAGGAVFSKYGYPGTSWIL